MTSYAQVAPPLPVPGLFTYAVPEQWRDVVVPGVRVSVPFGHRSLKATVVALADSVPEGVEAKDILDVLEVEPLVGPDILELAKWVAQTTGCSWGEALDASLPAAVKAARSSRRVQHVTLALDPAEVPAQITALEAKFPKQARALRILADRGGDLPARELAALAHVSMSPLKTLAKAGAVVFRQVVVEKDPLLNEHVAPGTPHTLTPDQAAAKTHVIDAFHRGASTTFVLHGVTGSGKTEVYLQILEHVVAQGRQGIVLVPEISLTPQTVRRFRERFERVAILHSHLTDAERADQWRRLQRGDADVVVGARSAIFAPVPRLGCVVVDEEHETSFKQQNVPRYHARELADKRAELAAAASAARGEKLGCVVVLGTATPSLEAYERVRRKRYALLSLPDRVAGGVAPSIQMVDLVLEDRRRGRTYLSDALVSSMDDALTRGGQCILFLNRRGWASVLMCSHCRAPVRCPHCEVSMTHHARVERAICHYCGHETAPPEVCPTCQNRLAPLAFGTEKVEAEARKIFPRHTVARMDSDTMTGRGAHAAVLEAYGDRRVDILIGTQMIAKGLDFPNTLLVGVICADSALFIPDYRASERTFQLIAQVVGRTGRGPEGGRVVVQAYDPGHLAIKTGVRQDYATFVQHELYARYESDFPPFVRLVRLVAHADELREADASLRDAVSRVMTGAPAVVPKANVKAPAPPPTTPSLFGDDPAPEPDAPAAAPAQDPVPDVTALGPALAPIPRIAGQHRMHVLFKCRNDAAVAGVIERLAGHLPSQRRLRVILDVDPVAVL